MVTRVDVTAKDARTAVLNILDSPVVTRQDAPAKLLEVLPAAPAEDVGKGMGRNAAAGRGACVIPIL